MHATPINAERWFRARIGSEYLSDARTGGFNGPEFQFSPYGAITEVGTHPLQTAPRSSNILEFIRARN